MIQSLQLQTLLFLCVISLWRGHQSLSPTQEMAHCTEVMTVITVKTLCFRNLLKFPPQSHKLAPADFFFRLLLNFTHPGSEYETLNPPSELIFISSHDKCGLISAARRQNVEHSGCYVIFPT